MHHVLFFVWLTQVFGAEPPAVGAYAAAKRGDLETASRLVIFALDRVRSPRESVSSWRGEQTQLAYLAGHLAMRRKKPKEAVVYFERALRWNDLFKEYNYHYLAEAQRQAGDAKAAIATYQLMLKQYRGTESKQRIRRALMETYQEAKDWEGYAVLSESLLRYSAPYGGRRHLLWEVAEGYRKAGKHKEAAKAFRKYALDYPHHRDAAKAEQWLRVWSEEKKIPAHAWTESEKSFRLYRLSVFQPEKALPRILEQLEALQKDPKPDKSKIEHTMKWQARSLIRMRRHREAIAILEPLIKATRSPWMRREAYKSLGQAYLEMGEFAKGLEALHAFTEREPEHDIGEQAAYRAIWMAMRLQQYAKARQLMEEYAIVYPEQKKKNRIFLWFREWTLFREGNYKEAIKAFQAWGKQNTKQGQWQRAAYWVGRAHERLGQWDKAKVFYRRIASNTPLTYYGILSQHRLYVLEDQIQQHHESYACTHASAPKMRKLLAGETKSKKAKKKSTASTKKKSGKKKQGKKETITRKKTPPRALLDPQQVGFTPAPPEGGDIDALHRSLRATVDQEFPKQSPFPTMPSSCRRSRSRGCLAFQRAELFDKLGLAQDAVDELYQARWYLQNSKKSLLEGIRWFYANGGYHEGVVLAFLLQRRAKQSPRLSTEQDFKLRYPLAYHNSLLAESRQSGVPFAFAWAITREESMFRIQTRSWADAFGLMQIIPTTAHKIAKRIPLQQFSIRDLYHPPTNIKMGCWYLGQLLEKFQSHIMLAAAAYNAGPHRVEVWLKEHHNVEVDEFVEEIPFQETRNYVKRVFRTYVIYNYFYNQTLPIPPTTVAVRVRQNIDF